MELKDQFKRLEEAIKKFLNDNKEIQKMIAKAEEIKAIFGDLDTSNLEKEFNNYINSLKNLYISIKGFTFSMVQKNKEIIISYYWKNKNAGGQPILDKLAQLPYLPKNIIEQIKQLYVVQSQMKKITDFSTI